MSKPLLPAWDDVSKPIIGMVHLLPLPGSPGFGGDVRAIESRALDDAAALTDGGVDGLMVENFGDSPFYPDRAPVCVVTHMTRLIDTIRRRFEIPLGVNVLRNDGRAALAIAHAVGAEFIRVNVLCGARVTDQGIVHGIAHDLLRDRANLHAANIRILADVNVKHSSSLGPPRPISDEVADLTRRGGADAVIVSGSGTGQAIDRAELIQTRAAAGDKPVLAGSGVDVDSVREVLSVADGAIVGTALKVDGIATNPVDPARVRALMARVR